MRVLIFSMVFMYSVLSVAGVHGVKLTSDFNIPAPRWMYNEKHKVNNKGISKNLYLIKKSQLEGKAGTCLLNIGKVNHKAKSLRPWLAVVQLDCALQNLAKNKKKGKALRLALTNVDKNEKWLLFGPQVKPLRKIYIEGLLTLIDFQFVYNRSKAWGTVDRALLIKNWLSTSQLARVYRVAGELAFVQQDLALAREYMLKSLNEVENRSLRGKLESLQKSLIIVGEAKETVDAEVAATDESLEATEKERKLLARMKKSLVSGDLVSGVEDGIDLIRKYPGGTRATWASQRVLESYYSVARKKENKFTLLKKRILNEMKRADSGRLLKWAKSLYRKGFYQDAVMLAQSSVDGYKGLSQSTKALELASRAAISSGEYKLAEKFFEKLFTEHAGTTEAYAALYRLGLLKFRQKKYVEASSYFERYLAFPKNEDYELQSRYWLWRAQQKLNPERAVEEAKKLFARFPLSYYGLRAQAELQQNKLSWPVKDAKPIKIKIWLTDSERLAWEKYQILVSAGWFKEASAELGQLPEPRTPEQQLIYAKLYALSFDYYKATKLANRAWDAKPSLVSVEWIKHIFPLEFKVPVSEFSKKNNLDPLLVTSLIRQESSFRVDAMSPARAMGLMQLMPGTAREVNRYLSKKKLNLPEDMFSAELNIRFGSNYLKRMVRAYKGHVPLALASYNVGIGNIRKWLRSRKGLDGLQGNLNSNPENEIWIDELPWAETSFYVKAILRNFILYHMISKKEIEVFDPIWEMTQK